MLESDKIPMRQERYFSSIMQNEWYTIPLYTKISHIPGDVLNVIRVREYNLTNPSVFIQKLCHI